MALLVHFLSSVFMQEIPNTHSASLSFRIPVVGTVHHEQLLQATQIWLSIYTKEYGNLL